MNLLTIQVTDQEYRSLEILAAQQGKTVNQYAVEKLLSGACEDTHAFDELKMFLHQRVDEAERGEVDHRSFAEITTAVIESSPRHE